MYVFNLFMYIYMWEGKFLGQMNDGSAALCEKVSFFFIFFLSLITDPLQAWLRINRI